MLKQKINLQASPFTLSEKHESANKKQTSRGNDYNHFVSVYHTYYYSDISKTLR